VQVNGRQLDTSAVPQPERYAVTGRLCHPTCGTQVVEMAQESAGYARDGIAMYERGVVIDKRVLTLLAEVARRHGFPRMRVTVEVLEDAAR